ncbi:hypothetical protein [Streptomyces sp. NRRL S-118]|nr:hypothetical protein [Streptomyces sp. NRRL S-118]
MTTSTDDHVSFPSGEKGELLRALAEQRELLLITVPGSATRRPRGARR